MWESIVIHEPSIRRPARTVVLLLLGLLAGCTSIQGQNKNRLSSQGRECASCHRMCEVAGERKDTPGAVQQCKKSCDERCKP